MLNYSSVDLQVIVCWNRGFPSDFHETETEIVNVRFPPKRSSIDGESAGKLCVFDNSKVSNMVWNYHINVYYTQHTTANCYTILQSKKL